MLRTMMEYRAWANARLFATLKTLPPTRLTAPQPIRFGSLLATAHHVWTMDRVWRAHLEQRFRPERAPHPSTRRPLAELAVRQAEMDAWLVAYAGDLSPWEEDEVVRFTFLDGRAGRMTRAEILMHAVNHATYHRGQIADMLSRVRVGPPVTDLPVFVRERDRDESAAPGA